MFSHALCSTIKRRTVLVSLPGYLQLSAYLRATGRINLNFLSDDSECNSVVHQNFSTRPVSCAKSLASMQSSSLMKKCDTPENCRVSERWMIPACENGPSLSISRPRSTGTERVSVCACFLNKLETTSRYIAARAFRYCRKGLIRYFREGFDRKDRTKEDKRDDIVVGDFRGRSFQVIHFADVRVAERMNIGTDYYSFPSLHRKRCLTRACLHAPLRVRTYA